jgi:hypothetical protein
MYVQSKWKKEEKKKEKKGGKKWHVKWPRDIEVVQMGIISGQDKTRQDRNVVIIGWMDGWAKVT